MQRVLRSFYARIAAVYLVMLIVLGAASVYVSFQSALQLAAEVEQRLHADYAANIAGELEPLLQNGPSDEEIGHAIHFMMVLNPQVEIYLLDPDGTIRAYFASSGEPAPEGPVDMRPVMSYLNRQEKSLLLGSDPRRPGRPKPFSAARLDAPPSAPQFVYVVLEGSRYSGAVDMVRNSYIARASIVSMVLIVVLAGAGGLAMFFLLTRRLRALSATVQSFHQGNLSPRVPVRGDDEIDRLGRSFNEMADRITADMEELEAADRERRELVANISHDLRSPLSSIQGYLETIGMKDAELSADERARLLDVSLKSTRTLQELAERLYELSRLDAREALPDLERVQPAELVQDVVLKLSPEAERRGLRLSVDLPGALPLVRADVGLLDRALTNLIDNAIRHTPADGSVSVCAEPSEEGVSIAVRDTGEGIPEEELPHIFKRFYRVDKSRSSDGSGLGLAIARRIVELHGSELHVESRLNRGTSFWFELAPAEVDRIFTVS